MSQIGGTGPQRGQAGLYGSTSGSGHPSVNPPAAPLVGGGGGIGPLKLVLGALVTGLFAGAALVGAQGVVIRLAGVGAQWQAGQPRPPAELPLAAVSSSGPSPTVEGIAAAIAPLRTAGLGASPRISIADAASGVTLYTDGADTPAVPASTIKLVTAITSLAARGPAYQIATRAVAGASPGEVVLVGGGDPTLSAGANGSYPGAARLDELAQQVRAALGSTVPSKVIYDSSLFTGDKLGPGWDADVPTGGYGAPVTALMADGARVNPRQVDTPSARVQQPDLSAAQSFAKALGVPTSAVTAGTAPPEGRQLGLVNSLPVIRLVEIMITESDNLIAEALARQVALAKGQPASFVGGGTAIGAVLTELGIPTAGAVLADGSGLSRQDRLTPATLIGVLVTAARPDQPQLHGLYSGLAVAGYSGTLADRFRSAANGSAAAGLVRAKTGTLSGVSAIAGTVVDADGRALAFAVMVDSSVQGTAAAQAALDRITAVLAACGCR